MNAPLLDSRGIVVVLMYLLSLLVLGFLANRASKESNLKDYYLAGSSLGIVSLFFTLYATQYSGTSLFATPGKAYSGGVIALSMPFGMMGIILVYSVIGPTLNRLSKVHQFVTVGDFVLWRFQNKGLLVVMNIVFIITLTNYTLANLKAIGFLLESATGGEVPFAAGICLVCVIMAMYESLGGMRSVVWTDIIQGVLLMFGCLLVFIFLQAFHEPGEMITPKVFTGEVKSFFSHSTNTGNFFSLSLLIALGAAVYPQAIQRIYAARDAHTLRRSYQMLLLMPLVTVLPIILIGMSATEWFPDLSRQESERVVILAINQLAEQLPDFSWLLILYLAAAIAAIMSTIDSALLSLGSIISKDITAKRFRHLNDQKLHRFSRLLTWGLMLIMGVLAIVLPQTIWALMVFKLELLIQVAPLIILGIHRTDISAQALLMGLLVGCVSTAVFKFSDQFGLPLLDMLWGIHAGMWALLLNLVTVAIVSKPIRRRRIHCSN